MKQLTLLLIGIILVFNFFCSCEPWFKLKEPKVEYLDYMPEETNIGANTFGCYVNGELVAARDWYQAEGLAGWNSRNVNGFWYDEYSNNFMLLSFSTKKYSITIHINMDNISLGEKKCSFSLGGFAEDVVEIIITKFDTEKQIICGRFNNIRMHSPNSTFYITNGQFDVKYGQDL